MSWDFSVTTTPVARKEYRCQAAEWLENDDIEEFTQEEQIIYAAEEREEVNYEQQQNHTAGWVECYVRHSSSSSVVERLR